jgi:Zn-finger nucleic acid-binding protein
MRCPIDETTLVMSERNGIEIDYCPQCRGVWLDRGELDKIIDRAGAPAAPLTQAPQYPQQAPQQTTPQGWAEPPRGQQPKKKRENWLGELFEFGG